VTTPQPEDHVRVRGTRVRGTRQAQALAAALDRLPGFCSAQEIHAHLTCRTCGRSVEVEGRAVEQWAERVAAEAGFTDVDHTVELFGRCPDCAALAREP
jgi:Fur family ferric uptake transcriptional regulator